MPNEIDEILTDYLCYTHNTKEAKSALYKVIEEKINKVRKEYEDQWDRGVKVSSFSAIEEIRNILRGLFNAE